MSTSKDDNDKSESATALTLSQVTTETTDDGPPTEPSSKFLYWDGLQPTAKGTVAKQLNQAPKEVQHINAYKFYKFLYSPIISDILINLQDEIEPLNTCIFHLPGDQRKVRVLHSIGSGLTPTKIASLTSNPRILGLTGENIEGLLPPQVLALDWSVLTPTEFHVPLEEAFDIALDNSDPTKFKANLFTASKVDNKYVGRQLMPIPPYLVLDGIDQDLDTFMLYERVRAIAGPKAEERSDLLQQLLHFLRTGSMSLTKNHNDIAIPMSTLLAQPDIAALEWRQRRMAQVYPPLPPAPGIAPTEAPTTTAAGTEMVVIDDDAPATGTTATTAAAPVSEGTTATAAPTAFASRTATATTAPAPAPASTAFASRTATATTAPAPTTAPTAPTASTAAFTSRGGVIEMSEKTLLEIFREMKEAVRTSARASTSGSSDDDEDSETLGLAPSAYNTLLAQCGLAASLADDMPSVWKKLSEKKLTKADKLRIVRLEIDKNVRYRSNKVPNLTSIYNMVVECKFEGEQVPSSLLSAVKGLSPFAVPRLSNSEVDHRNALEDDLAAATSTTVKDLAGTKLQCTAPTSFEGLVKQLKRFCNLCFACFGDSSPMVTAMVDLIDNLEDYNDLEQSTMSRRTIAAILWIVLLQARHFAAGLMTGDTPNTMVFEHMLMAITGRMPIVHTGVPPSLYVDRDNANKHTLDNIPDHSNSKRLKSDAPPPPTSKLQDRSAVVHESMKKAMAPFVAMSPRPSIRHICQAAGTTTAELFPATPNLCLKAQLWGRCDKFYKFDHIRIPQEAITGALARLKPVLDKPESVKKVN